MSRKQVYSYDYTNVLGLRRWQSSTLTTQAAGYYDTLMLIYQSTRGHISEQR
jgi:hypothetical protein